MNDTVQVNLALKKTTKETLNAIKKEMGINQATLVDSLLQFDADAADLFLELFKKKNPDKVKDYNYLRMPNGGLVYRDSVMQKIVDSNVSELTEDGARRKGIEIIEETLRDEKIPETDARALMKRLATVEQALISVHREYKKQRGEIDSLQSAVNNSSGSKQ